MGNVRVNSLPETKSAISKMLAVTSVKTLADFGFTADEIAAADVIIISCATNSCRFLHSGDVPTTTFGHPITPDNMIVCFGGQAKIAEVQVVSLSDTSNVTISLEEF